MKLHVEENRAKRVTGTLNLSQVNCEACPASGLPDTPTKFPSSLTGPKWGLCPLLYQLWAGRMVLNKSYEPPLDLEIVSASLWHMGYIKATGTLNREVQLSDTENLK